jgi:hypothetical protein
VNNLNFGFTRKSGTDYPLDRADGPVIFLDHSWGGFISRLENEDELDRMAELLKAGPEILDRRRQREEPGRST